MSQPVGVWKLIASLRLQLDRWEKTMAWSCFFVKSEGL